MLITITLSKIKLLYFLYSFIVLCLSITLFWFDLHIQSNFLYRDQIQDIVGNWMLDAVQSLRLLQPGELCLQDEEYISNYIWSGTKNGCQCTTNQASQQKQQITVGTCDLHDLQNQCQDKAPIPQQILHAWHNQHQPAQYCIKRLKDSRFINQYKSQLIACPFSTQKDCGNFQYIGKLFCIQNDQQCPITNIQNTGANNFKSNEQIGEFSINRIPDNQGFVTGFKISGGTAVCQDNKKDNIEYGLKDHILQSVQRTNCNISNSNYQIIQFSKYTEYLQYNQILDQVMSIYDYFTTYDQMQIGIYQQYIIPWQKTCSDINQLDYFISQVQNINSNLQTKKNIFVLSIILLSLYGINFFSSFVQYLEVKRVIRKVIKDLYFYRRSCWRKTSLERSIKDYVSLFTLFFILYNLVLLIILIIQLDIRTNQNNGDLDFVNIMKFYSENKCSNSQMNAILVDQYNLLYNLYYNYQLLSQYINISLIIIEFSRISLFWYFVVKLKREKFEKWMNKLAKNTLTIEDESFDSNLSGTTNANTTTDQKTISKPEQEMQFNEPKEKQAEISLINLKETNKNENKSLHSELIQKNTSQQTSYQFKEENDQQYQSNSITSQISQISKQDNSIRPFPLQHVRQHVSQRIEATILQQNQMNESYQTSRSYITTISNKNNKL